MGRLFNRSAFWGITGAQDLIPRRYTSINGTLPVTPNEALKNSAVWAAIRLRAELISTLPWRVYRNYTDPDIISAAPMKLDAPPSPMMANARTFMEFLYSSQVELDRSGNAIGIIRAWEPRSHLPSEIELVASSSCIVKATDNKITDYHISGIRYSPDTIWHEKQYTIAGLPIGLSPVEYAAYTLGQYRSIQEFATEWFTSGQGPRASLQNTEKKINDTEAAVAAESWRASQAMDEPFIHGSNWEYKLVNGQAASTDWIEGAKLNTVDAARFFNVPADLIDAAISGGSHVTYANVVQRNLQFLVMHLGPPIMRREAAMTEIMPRPRIFEFDTDFLMRMDPLTRAQWIEAQINARTITPDEGRALYGRAPMTDAQYEEYFKAGLVHGKTAVLPGDPMDPNSPAGQGINEQIEGNLNGRSR